MLRDDAVTLLKGRLARFNGTALDSYILDEMKAAQRELEREATLPWFLVSDSSSASTTISDDRVPIPGDFLREVEGDMLGLVTDSGKVIELLKDDYEYIRQRYPVTLEGQPVRYDLMGKYFRLRPVPDAVYVLKMIYYQKAAVLNTNIENLWLQYADDLLLAKTGLAIASGYLRDKAGVQIMTGRLQEARRRMFVEEQARKDANRTYVAED